MSSDSGQAKQGLTFWQKVAMAIVVAFVVVVVLVFVASQTLTSETLG